MATPLFKTLQLRPSWNKWQSLQLPPLPAWPPLTLWPHIPSPPSLHSSQTRFTPASGSLQLQRLQLEYPITFSSHFSKVSFPNYFKLEEAISSPATTVFHVPLPGFFSIALKHLNILHILLICLYNTSSKQGLDLLCSLLLTLQLELYLFHSKGSNICWINCFLFLTKKSAKLKTEDQG